MTTLTINLPDEQVSNSAEAYHKNTRRGIYRELKSFRVRLMDLLSYDSILGLTYRHNLTFYDAAYLDLAMREGAPLASLDKHLILAAEKSGLTRLQP